MKYLNLVLKSRYYHMTGEPGKMFELRKPSKWLMSRLLNRDGSKKEFDGVELCRGYRKDRKTKIRELTGWAIIGETAPFILPNKEILTGERGDIIIFLK